MTWKLEPLADGACSCQGANLCDRRYPHSSLSTGSNGTKTLFPHHKTRRLDFVTLGRERDSADRATDVPAEMPAQFGARDKKSSAKQATLKRCCYRTSSSMFPSSSYEFLNPSHTSCSSSTPLHSVLPFPAYVR